MVLRLDTSGKVSRVERLPQGGIRVEAALTRSGVLTYAGPDGRPVYEYRPPAEVARADSLASLADAPVTDRHPRGRVTPSTYKGVTVGHVSGEARIDGDLVLARLVVQDADALAAIEAGTRREVSCGYTCDLLDTPGETPEGVKFDKVQTNIVYNHVAIVEQGRAGSRVALRLDSLGDTQIEDSEMEELAKAQAELAKAQADLAKAEARADAADAAKAKAEARADAAESPEAVARAVAARVGLERDAAKVLGADFRADGLADHAIRVAVVSKAFPALKLDGKPAEYVATLYDAAIAQGVPAVKADSKAVAEDRQALTPKAEDRIDLADLENKARAAARDLWRQPLAAAAK